MSALQFPPTPASLRPVHEHQEWIRGLLCPTDNEWISRDTGLGRVLGGPVVANESLPSFDNSAMDGYAVRATDIIGASAQRSVVLSVAADIPAGAARGVLSPGTAHRIMTGAPVPEGADTIVEVESTDGDAAQVVIHTERPPGSFVRVRGVDVSAGAEVLPAGVVVGAAQIGVLAALGVAEIVVRRRPRVLVCSTGSELTDDPDPAAGQIRDANGHQLAAAVELAGGVAVRRLWVSDDVSDFLAAVEAGAAEADLVLTTGGVSAGAYEVVKEALEPAGVEFTKVAMQPGMPQGSGTFAGVPIVCLPGNPVSALASFEVFVRPAIRASYGHPRPARQVIRASLHESITSVPGRRQFRRGRLDRTTMTVRPWGPPGSGYLGWFAGADCLIDVPSEATAVEAGETIDTWDLSG